MAFDSVQDVPFVFAKKESLNSPQCYFFAVSAPLGKGLGFGTMLC